MHKYSLTRIITTRKHPGRTGCPCHLVFIYVDKGMYINFCVERTVYILMDRGDLIPFNTIIVTDVHRAQEEPLWWYPNVFAAIKLIHTETKCVLIYNFQ